MNFAGLFVSNIYGQQDIKGAEKILGHWETHDGRAVIEIYKARNLYFGKIKAIPQENSPQANSLIDYMVLKDFSFLKGKFVDGTMHDPETGNMYQCKLWLEDNNTLKVRDYCGMFFKTFRWKRVN